MALYETVIISTASDDQEIQATYNNGMCATVTVFDGSDRVQASFDANEQDLTNIINELTAIRDAIRSVKRANG